MENFILELAKVTIPGLLVLLTTYYLLRDFFKNEERKRYYEMRRETAKSLNPGCLLPSSPFTCQGCL